MILVIIIIILVIIIIILVITIMILVIIIIILVIIIIILVITIMILVIIIIILVIIIMILVIIIIILVITIMILVIIIIILVIIIMILVIIIILLVIIIMILVIIIILLVITIMILVITIMILLTLIINYYARSQTLMLVKVTKMTKADVIDCGKVVVRAAGLRTEVAPKFTPVWTGVTVASGVAVVEKMLMAVCAPGAFAARATPMHVIKTVEVLRQMPAAVLEAVVAKFVIKTAAVEVGCAKYIRLVSNHVVHCSLLVGVLQQGGWGDMPPPL